MALVPLYRDAPTGAVVGKLKAGTNVTISEATVAGMLEVTVAASGGGGGGGTPSPTVGSGTTPGLSPVVGVSTDFARGDHSHGTPTVPAHTALSALSWASAGHTGSSTAVAAWNGGGTAAVVQATTDETMLVRRAGALQWVPLVLSVVFLPESDLIMDDVVYTMDGAVVFAGSIL